MFRAAVIAASVAATSDLNHNIAAWQVYGLFGGVTLPIGLQNRKHSFAKAAAAAAVGRLFSPVSASKPATFLQREERAARSICRLWSGRSELGISGQVASSSRKFQSLKTILRIYAAPDAQFCGPSSIGVSL